jgi:hypothetical protein
MLTRFSLCVKQGRVSARNGRFLNPKSCASFPSADENAWPPVEEENPERDTIDEFENAKLEKRENKGAK